jgi:hypothetical protein
MHKFDRVSLDIVILDQMLLQRIQQSCSSLNMTKIGDFAQIAAISKAFLLRHILSQLCIHIFYFREKFAHAIYLSNMYVLDEPMCKGK